MPLYCTTTIGGVDFYLSTEFLADLHMWNAKIASITQITAQMKTSHGGFLAPSYGSIDFVDDVFVDNWPPPSSISQIIESGASEATKITVCESDCVLSQFSRGGVTYTANAKSSDITDSSANFSTSDLNAVFAWACDVARLNLTLDTTFARNPSPDVSHINSSERLIMDMISEAAAFFNHTFYITNSTLYLIDLKGNTGTVSIDEFDFTPNTYNGRDLIAEVKSTTPEVVVTGASPNGKSITIAPWHTNAVNVETALTNIKDYLEKDLISVELVDVESDVTIGNEVTLIDESNLKPIITTFVVTKKNLNYSSGTEKLILEGRGAITNV